MSSGGEKLPRVIPSRRELIAMIVVGVLVIVAGVTASLAISRSVFSATGFVSSYMDALIRRDAPSALSMPGVVQGDNTAFLASPQAALLTSNALPAENSRRAYRIVSDDVAPGASATHRVTVSTSLSDRDVVFEVRETASFGGLFAQWVFVKSPLAAVTVTTEHATFFNVDGFGPIDIVSVDPTSAPSDFTARFTFPVLAPSKYAFSIDSRAITSGATTVVATPGETSSVVLTAEPTSDFVKRVQNEVNSYFEKCVAQKVLLPSGCLFGIGIENRVVGEPTWSVATYPVVALVAGESGWEISPATMSLTFSADIQSLFDGSVTSVTEDIPLTIGGTVGLSASGDIAVLIRRVA